MHESIDISRKQIHSTITCRITLLHLTESKSTVDTIQKLPGILHSSALKLSIERAVSAQDKECGIDAYIVFLGNICVAFRLKVLHDAHKPRIHILSARVHREDVSCHKFTRTAGWCVAVNKHQFSLLPGSNLSLRK